MPVKITKTKGLQLTANGSPNQSPAALSEAEYPFKYEDTHKGKKRWIAVSKPFCDRITIIGKVTADALAAESGGDKVGGTKSTQLAAFHQAFKTSLNKAAEAGFKSAKPIHGFKIASTEVGRSDAPMTFGVSQKTKGDGFTIRMDFNPRRLGKSGFKEIENLWIEASLGSFSFDAWLSGARISRVDVAVDILNVHVSDLLLRHPQATKASGYFSKEGQVETSALNKKAKGSTKAPAFLQAYDKRREQLDNGAEPKHGAIEHTRVEYRHSNASKPFRQLKHLKNYLSELSIGSISQAAEANAWPDAWSLFAGAAQHIGANAATMAAGESGPSFQAAFLSTEATFWEPKTYWKAWLDSPSDKQLSIWVGRAQEYAKNHA